jgi:multisubunit Na+/H+ antiporter MnhE subunit
MNLIVQPLASAIVQWALIILGVIVALAVIRFFFHILRFIVRFFWHLLGFLVTLYILWYILHFFKIF